MDDLSIITEQDPKTDQVFLTCGHKCDQIPTTFCLQSLYPHFRFRNRPQIIYATTCTLHLVLLLFFFVLNLSLAFDIYDSLRWQYVSDAGGMKQVCRCIIFDCQLYVTELK